MQATDGDVGQNAQITYTLTSNIEHSTDSFSINPQTGAIITTKLLDRESINSYLLTVTARDGGMEKIFCQFDAIFLSYILRKKF